MRQHGTPDRAFVPKKSAQPVTELWTTRVEDAKSPAAEVVSDMTCQVGRTCDEADHSITEHGFALNQHQEQHQQCPMVPERNEGMHIFAARDEIVATLVIETRESKLETIAKRKIEKAAELLK